MPPATPVQASRVAEFLVDRNLAKSDWALRLGELEEVKSTLINRTLEASLDDSVKNLLHTKSCLEYADCRELLALLIAGKDGEAKFSWLFGGGFKSSLIIEWTELIRKYEADSLILVESAAKLRRLVVEGDALRSELRDTCLLLVDLEEKLAANTAAVAALEIEAEHISAEIGIDILHTPTAEVKSRIEEKFANDKHALIDQLHESLRHPTFIQAVRDYENTFNCTLNALSGDRIAEDSVHAVEVQAEELYSYHRMSTPDLVLDAFDTVRSAVKRVLSANLQTQRQTKFAHITTVKRGIQENCPGQRILAVIQRARGTIAELNERLHWQTLMQNTVEELISKGIRESSSIHVDFNR